jgi:hypothetical protein
MLPATIGACRHIHKARDAQSLLHQGDANGHLVSDTMNSFMWAVAVIALTALAHTIYFYL